MLKDQEEDFLIASTEDGMTAELLSSYDMSLESKSQNKQHHLEQEIN